VGADPTWPNRARYSIPCDVIAGFRWGRGGPAGTHSWLGRVRRQSCSGERVCGVVWFVLCFLLICTVVVVVPFVCCSVKLPLSQPTSFCLFLFILLRTPAGGGVAAWRFCCRRQPKPKQTSRRNLYSKIVRGSLLHLIPSLYIYCFTETLN